MSDKKCCVPSCNVTHLDGLTLHCFPNPDKDTDRFRSWLFAVGGDVLSLNNNVIYKSRRVCHKHFDIKYRTWTRRLTPNAIPTLHLRGITRTHAAEPMMEITKRNNTKFTDLKQCAFLHNCDLWRTDRLTERCFLKLKQRHLVRFTKSVNIH